MLLQVRFSSDFLFVKVREILNQISELRTRRRRSIDAEIGLCGNANAAQQRAKSRRPYLMGRDPRGGMMKEKTLLFLPETVLPLVFSGLLPYQLTFIDLKFLITLL